jgi:hypothetical protein
MEMILELGVGDETDAAGQTRRLTLLNSSLLALILDESG